MLHCTRLKRLSSDKHSSLLGVFVSYYENVTFRLLPQGPYSQHLIVILTYKWAQYARVLHYTMIKKLSGDKHASLLGAFVGY